MTTSDRRPCPFDVPNGGSVLDQTTFDRLHSVAGGLSYTARRVEGVGGVTTEDSEDVFDLMAHAVRIVGLAHDALDLAVDAARDHGWTWEQVGDTLGTTRQAAQMRFGKPKSCADCGHPDPHAPGRCEFFTAPKTAFPGSIERCPCGK